MSIDFDVKTYREWLKNNITLSDPFSPSSLRTMVEYLLLGKNYRLLTEKNTKGKLLATYIWLTRIYEKAKKKYGDDWREKLMDDMISIDYPDEEIKDLMSWLMGLTHKGSINLEISKENYPDALKEMIEYCRKLFSKMGIKDKDDHAWLLLMAGSATLNIRGSQKSKSGKKFEHIFLRTLLRMLGLKENKDFWLNPDRDTEVGRESDVEVRTRRGRIRIELALIASGNQEVIEDKISRVGKNGIVLFDRVGARTRIYETAKEKQVKLIQIRNNQPLTEVYRHLKPLVDVKLKEPPETESDLKKRIDKLPNSVFN